jgi:hypothetical protein
MWVLGLPWMESQVWPMSVLKVALRVLRVPQLVLTKPDLRRERLRRAVISSAAPPGKNMTAVAAVQPPAHAGERTLSGTVPGGIPCHVGPHSSDATFCATSARDITHTHTQAHTHTHTHTHKHTHTQCSTVTAWLVARGAATRGCFVPVVPVMPRLAPMCTGGLQGHCDTPPRCAADRFCSSKVRCARPLLPMRVACRHAHVQSTSRRGIHASFITPPQVHTPSGATTARLWRTRTDPKAVGFNAYTHARTHC